MINIKIVLCTSGVRADGVIFYGTKNDTLVNNCDVMWQRDKIHGHDGDGDGDGAVLLWMVWVQITGLNVISSVKRRHRDFNAQYTEADCACVHSRVDSSLAKKPRRA